MLSPPQWLQAVLLILLAALQSACSNDSVAPQEPESEDSSSGPSGATATTEEANHEQMLAWLLDIQERCAQENPYQGDQQLQLVRAEFEALPAEASVNQRISLLTNIGEYELERGDEEQAIETLSAAYELLPAGLAEGLDPESARMVTFRLGVAYMRLGEAENCCARHVPGSCILPIEGEAVHTKPTGSTRAMEFFAEVMEGLPDDSMQSLEARWLLNVAAMTLGTFPGSVPESRRIPPEAFAPVRGFPRFENIAGKLGLDTFSLSGGACADDFDGDGNLDLIVSTWDTSGQLRYFHNDGDGSFSDQSQEAGLSGLFGGLNMIQGDYDNDGDPDLYILRGAWLFEAGKHPNSLLRNDGGHFTDVTISAGMGLDHFPTQAASWADYDLDGDLDLFVGNESTARLTAPCQLWRNEGDGHFTDVAHQAGVTNMAFAKACVWGDFDNDRYPDLYVSNLEAENRLYRNLGNGTFEDVAGELGVTRPIASFPTWFWDANNDGNLDLFVSAYATTAGALASSYMGRPTHSALIPRLYGGDGKGGFKSIGEQAGLVRPSLPMGANFGDLDGDGFLDFFLGTGDPDFKNLVPNSMLMNRSGRFFMDVSTAGGFAHLQKGHAIVFADLDNDGDQDVFEQMGGAYLGDGFHDALYENPGFGNRWLKVELVGTRSNRSGIGARLRVILRQGPASHSVYRHVNSGASFGANPLRQTLGLGQATSIERLEVFWPVSGETQVFAGIPLNSAIRITEGSEDYESVKLDTIRFGVASSR